MKPLKFVHIPKCAGTSIEYIGKEKGLLWGIYDRELNRKELAFKTLPVCHTPLSYFIDIQFVKDYLDKYDLFAVVRNPYTRCISTYFFNNRKGYYENNYTIENMNKFIKENLYENNYSYYGHFIPQYKFIYDQSNQIVKHILKFENINNEFIDLMKLYNLIDLTLDNIFMRSTKNSIDKWDDFQKLYNVTNLYPETIDNINKFYHLDFIYFNYDKLEHILKQ
jgi:hypothetical protein